MTEARETTERAVVGCMLIDSRAIDSLVEQGGSASWFVDPQCRKVAQAVLERYEQGKIASDMLAINELGLVPMSWMDECIELVPTVAHTEHYVATLKGHADKDALIALERAVSQIVTHCTPETVQEARASIEAALSASLRIDNKQGGTISQAAHEAIDEATAPDANTNLVDWPLCVITETIGRLRDDVVVVNALPSLGKTALVLQWMAHLASRGQASSLASLESSMKKIALRFVSSQAPMDTRNIRHGKADDAEIVKARAAADGLSDLIRVTDSNMTLDQLFSWGKSEVRKGSKALFVDNTKSVIVRSDGKVEKFSMIFERMTQLRKDTGVPVIILHHSTVGNDGKERASWGQDQDRDADLQIFLRHVEEKSIKPCKEHPDGVWCVAFDVDKNRDGTRFIRILLKFDKPRQRFERWIDDGWEDEANLNEVSSDSVFDNI